MSMTEDCLKLMKLMKEKGRLSLPEILRGMGFDLSHASYLLGELERDNRVKFIGGLDYEFIPAADGENRVPQGIAAYDRWGGYITDMRRRKKSEADEEWFESENEQLMLERCSADQIPNHWEREYFQRIAVKLHRGFQIELKEGQCYVAAPGSDFKMRIVKREGEFYLTDCGTALEELSRSVALEWEGAERLIGQMIAGNGAFRFGNELALPILVPEEAVATVLALQRLIAKISNVTAAYIIAACNGYEEDRKKYSLVLFKLTRPDNADGSTRQSAVAFVKDKLNGCYRGGSPNSMAMYMEALKALQDMSDEEYDQLRGQTRIES